MPNPSSLRLSLFYSYSHKAFNTRGTWETILANLARDALLRDWSDAQILPGQSISTVLQAKLSDSDIIAFLLSPDFLASEECRKEWRFAKHLAVSGRLIFRVPIICSRLPLARFSRRR